MLRRDAAVVGVDGTKGGWVAVALDGGGSNAGDDLLQPIESEFAELWDADVIAIDVPIGYGHGKQTEPRARFCAAARLGACSPCRHGRW